MNDFVSWFLSIGGQLGNWSYFLLAVIAFLEALPLVGFFIPGVVVLIIGGFLVSQDLLSFPTVLVIVAVSAFIGDCIAFAIGRRFTSSFRSDHPLLKKSYLKTAERFTKRWGGASLFIGRFLSSVRSMINVVVGVSGMPWLNFCLRAAIGCLLFSFVYLGIGYIAGSAWQTIESWSSRAAIFITATVLLIAFLWWLKGFLVRQGRQLKELAATILRTAFQAIESRLSLWLSRRLNPSSFFGLPFLSLSALILALIIFVLWLGFSAPLAGTFWANLDGRMISFITLFLNDHIAATAFLISVFGSLSFIAVVGVAYTFWLLIERRLSYIIGLWLAIGGTLLTSAIIKFILARPRPTPVFYFENSYAFPSSHAALALVFFMFLAYYAIRSYPRWSRNVSVVFIASIIAGLVAWSRLYLGVHYLSDVLGGFAIALIWLIIAIIVGRRLESLDKPRRLSKIWQTIILAGIILFVFINYFSKALDTTAIKNTYRLLPQSTIEYSSVQKSLSFGSWPLRTENLRGTRERPLSFVFQADKLVLIETFKKSDWVERQSPTVTSVMKIGSRLLFKTPYPDSPLQLRFWRNEPNELSFTKSVPSDKEAGGKYVLRLWSAPISQTDNNSVFVAELWVNRDFPLPLPPQQLILESAQNEFLTDLSTAPTFRNRETIEVTTEDLMKLPIEIITLSK